MAGFIELSPDLLFLIVDESQAVRDTMGQILKNMGLKRIIQSTDSTNAFDLLKREQINFIICDRTLRTVSGMEFLKEIRESPEFGRVPFMMMSGDIPKEDVLLASEFGVDGYLKKPFVMKDVSARLSACMARFNQPNTSEALFEQAREAYSKGAFGEALTIYEKIKESLPTSARVRVGEARCHRNLGSNQRALEILQEAVSKNDMYVHAFQEMGMVHVQLGDFDEALKAFNRAIEISPSNPARYEQVGEILMRHEKFAEAETHLMKAVRLELVYPVLYEQLGKALFAQKKIDKAYQYFERALRSQPENISFLNSMGICMKELKRFEDAINYYNQALKQRPQDVKILFNKMLCLVELGQTDRAIKTCQQILKIDPNYEKAKRRLDMLNKTLAATPAAAKPPEST